MSGILLWSSHFFLSGNWVLNSSYTSSKWPWSLGKFEHSTRWRWGSFFSFPSLLRFIWRCFPEIYPIFSFFTCTFNFQFFWTSIFIFIIYKLSELLFWISLPVLNLYVVILYQNIFVVFFCRIFCIFWV